MINKKTRNGKTFKLVSVFLGFPIYLWCVTAVYFLPAPFPWLWLRILVMCLLGIGVPLALVIFKCDKYSLSGSYVAFALIIALICLKKPSNECDWAPSVAKLPQVQVKGDLVSIANVRNFKYKSADDFDVAYYARTYDASKLETLWMALSYWDGNRDIAHTIFSFGFENGDYLAVSNEVRLPKNQKISLLGGIFKEYEIIYILADEADVLELRTNVRGEEVYLYQVLPKKGKEDIRSFFLYLMKKVRSLKNKPVFYNTLTSNCLTSILHDFSASVDRKIQFDYRLVMNGYFDKLLYERSVLETWGLSFDKLRKQRHINQYVVPDPSDYSKKIRTPPDS